MSSCSVFCTTNENRSRRASLNPSRSSSVMVPSWKRDRRFPYILDRLISATTPTCRRSSFIRFSSAQNFSDAEPGPANIMAYSWTRLSICRSCHSGSRERNSFQSDSLICMIISELLTFLHLLSLCAKATLGFCTFSIDNMPRYMSTRPMIDACLRVSQQEGPNLSSSQIARGRSFVRTRCFIFLLPDE